MHVESGRVRLSVREHGGKEGIVGLVGPGGYLGEEALAGLPERRETATAITAVTVLVVAKARMLRLVHTDSVVSDLLVAHLLARGASLEHSLSDQLLLSSEQRVARCLLELAECRCHLGRTCVLPPVSQSVIAEMAGTTRSHVNMFMARFRKLGLLQQRARELVVMPSLLTVIDSDTIHDARRNARRARRVRGTAATCAIGDEPSRDIALQ
jgi:CRP-like cAMP-binding protein